MRGVLRPLALVLVVMRGVTWLPAAEFTNADAEALRAAVQQVEAEMVRQEAAPTQDLERLRIIARDIDAMAKASLHGPNAERERIQAIEERLRRIAPAFAREMAAVQLENQDEVQETFADILAESGLGGIEGVSAASYVASNDPQDLTVAVNPSDMAVDRKQALWVFWAIDAKNDVLARQLEEVRRRKPAVAVADVHLMPLKRWQALAQVMQTFQIRMEAFQATGEMPDAERERLRHESQGVMLLTQGFTDMVKLHRPGGYRIVDDVSTAEHFAIERVPTIIYKSERGIEHRMEGCSVLESLLQFIERCEAWEADQVASGRVFE